MRKKLLNLIKEKAKPNKKEISKDEAEKILKEAHKHDHNHDHDHDQKIKKAKSKNYFRKKTSTKALKIKARDKKS